MLNTSNTAGIVPSVVPLKQGPNKRLPDFLIAFLRCSLANKPTDLLRRLYQFLWKSTVKTNPDDWGGAEAHLEKDGDQKCSAGAVQLLLTGSGTALLVTGVLNFFYQSLLLFHNQFHWESTELFNHAVMDFCISLLLVYTCVACGVQRTSTGYGIGVS